VVHVSLAINRDKISVVTNSVTKMDTTVNYQMKVVMHVMMAIPGDKISMVMSFTRWA